MSKRRIFAIDDDEELLDLYQAELGRLGYEVRTTAHGATARAELLTFKPDLIVMDVMMPGMDGISLTKTFRADAAVRDIPILVVSGLTDAATLNDALLFGATDYLVKPFDLKDLERKVERALAAGDRRKAKKP